MSVRVRARHMQVFLAQADATPGLGTTLRAALDPEELAAIERAQPVSWLPVETNLRVTHATMDLLDDAAAHEFFRNFMLQDFEKPFLKPVVKLATGLFGMEVGSFVRLVPRGWGQVFDGAARLVPGDSGHHFAYLDFLEVAPVLMDDGGRWAKSVAWSLTSLLAVAHREGTVRIEDSSVADRVIRYRFDWR